MSLSCRFLAVGAVRFPSGRLIPKAAQSMLERTSTGNGSGLNSLEEILFHNNCMRGLPLPICVFKSSIGFWASAKEMLGAMDRIAPVAADTFKNSLRFIFFSIIIPSLLWIQRYFLPCQI